MTRKESPNKSPKKTCQTCKEQTCLKTGKPCDEIETLLRSEGVKSRDWIRPRVSPERTKREDKSESNYLREIPVENIEKTSEVRAFNLKFSRKVKNDEERE